MTRIMKLSRINSSPPDPPSSQWFSCPSCHRHRPEHWPTLWPLCIFFLLTIVTSPASCFAIQGPSFLAKRTSVPYEGLRSKPGLFQRPFNRFPESRPQPESKFRDAISGYSVDLDEDETSRLLKSKLSLYSSSLNVLDGHPEDTELAHSILLVHKKKSPSAQVVTSSHDSTSASSLSTGDSLSGTLDSKEESAAPSLASSLSYFTTSMRPTTTTSTTSSTPKPPSTVKFSAHTFKPFSVSSSLSYAPPSVSSLLKFKNKPSSGTFLFGNFTQVTSFDPNARPSFVSNNHRPSTSSSPTRIPTRRRPVFAASTESSIDRIDDDDEPVVVHSNHRKTFLMRHKLTSETDHWTTPITFTEIPHRTQPTASPQTFYPPYSSTVTSRPHVSTPTSFVSVHSRPPLKVTAVHADRNKSPDSVASAPMLVLDSNGNVTIMHQKLIVPYKPGRPKPSVSSIGTILTSNSPVRTKPTASEAGDAIDDKNDAEITTYYPQSLFKPTTQYPACRDCPWTMETEMTTYPSTSTTPFITISTTTKDPMPADASSHIIVTKRPPYPAATVNAILAPPMPSRPISTPAPIGNTGIFSSLMGVLGVDSTGGLMSRLTLLKTALFTLLVMFLPPLTLAAAVAQLL